MLRKVEVLQCLLMVVQLHAVFAVFLDLWGGVNFSHSWTTPLSFDQHTAPSAPSMSNNERLALWGTTQEHAGVG